MTSLRRSGRCSPPRRRWGHATAAVEEMGATISGAAHRWGCCATRRHGWPEDALSSRTRDAPASTVSLARGMRDRSGLEARIDVRRVADFLLVNVVDNSKAAAAAGRVVRALLRAAICWSRTHGVWRALRWCAWVQPRPWCALCTPRQSSAGAATAGGRARRRRQGDSG
jgi:transposase-like protein